ncbi:MAG: GntR family transcriptional regulator [Abditibacteriota bacterium]|nr:GntR family transcriptional regulator [Abditibacteriota bacterium]
MEKKDLIINYVLEQIQLGKYKPGTRIRSEFCLSEDFKVSRATVREALSVLSDKGIIYKVKGSGSYVSEDLGKMPRYILIATNESTLIEGLEQFNKNLIDDLKKNITQKGYIPYLILEKNSKDYPNYTDFEYNDLINYFNKDVSEIAGVISLSSNDDNLKSIEQNNIPIVNVRTIPNIYPSVIISYEYFIKQIIRMIKHYNFKDVLLFHYFMNEFVPEIQNIFQYGIESYFRNNYKVYDIPISNSPNEISKHFEQVMKSLKKTPDCIIFYDNTIYQNSLSVFHRYDKILKKTKIITHSNKGEIFPSEYDICRLCFDIEKISAETINLLFSFINKETVIKTNSYIKCDIVNEECLK